MLCHSRRCADGLCCICCLLQGSMYSCQNPSGQPFDAEYVLPAGQHITRDWCLNSSLQVTTSAYHSSINITVPPYTPQRE